MDKPYTPRGNGPRSGNSGNSGDRRTSGYQKSGGKPTYGKDGQNRSYGDKPRYGDKPAYSKDGQNRSYGDKPRYGDKPAYNKDGQSRSYGDKPRYGDKPAYNKDGQSRSYGDKPRYGDKPAYNKDGQNRSYGDKPRSGNKPYADKPAYNKRDAYRRDDADARPGRERQPEEAAQQGDENELPFLIIGRNAVREAIKSGRSLDCILVSTEQDGSLGEIVSMAKDKKIVLRTVERKKLDEVTLPFGHGGKPANHQGIVAYAAGVEYCGIEDILAVAKEKNEAPFLIILDGVTDPHNLGSVIRSAECAGAHGVVIGKRRSASVTAATVKSAAGATEYVKIARVPNIVSAIEQLKSAGVWIAGADMDGVAMEQCALSGPLALVIGSEGDGLSRLVREKCDLLAAIPMTGKIGSLNAAVAAAVLMFEKKRQDAHA